MLKVLKKTYRRTKSKRKKVCKVFDRGNCFLSESEDKLRRKRLSYFILGLACLLVVVPSLFLLKYKIEVSVFPVSKEEMYNDQQINTLSLIVYRHYIAYDEYCTKLGVPLNEYPAKFMGEFQNEVDFLRGYLKGKRASDLESIFSKIRYKFSRAVDRTTISDFDHLKIVLEKEYQLESSLFSHKDVCHLLEEKAGDILEKGLSSDYKKIHKIGSSLLF